LFLDRRLLRDPARRGAAHEQRRRKYPENQLRGDARIAADPGKARLRCRPGGWGAWDQEPGPEPGHADQVRPARRRLAHGGPAHAPAHGKIIPESVGWAKSSDGTSPRGHGARTVLPTRTDPEQRAFAHPTARPTALCSRSWPRRRAI